MGIPTLFRATEIKHTSNHGYASLYTQWVPGKFEDRRLLHVQDLRSSSTGPQICELEIMYEYVVSINQSINHAHFLPEPMHTPRKTSKAAPLL